MTETAGTNIVRFDDDAEQSVLGAAMMAPKYWTKIRERVGAEDFYRPAHRRIFQEIEAAVAEGLEPDPITIADRLQGDELVEALGGRGYLFSLPTVSVATRGPQHADIVRRLAQERKREHRLAELLTLVEEYIARYVLLSLPEQRTATVLWTAHTWIVEQFDTTPYLAFLSPEKRSGKSRVLEVLDKLVARPWLTVRPSEAVLFRNIEARRVTLLLDEIDTIFGRKAGSNYEGIRAILNAGFRRGMNVPRCVGEGTNIQVVDFAVYGAKAFAGIGNLPDTVRDRSIILDMVRRASDEPVERFRFREASAAASASQTGRAVALGTSLAETQKREWSSMPVMIFRSVPSSRRTPPMTSICQSSMERERSHRRKSARLRLRGSGLIRPWRRRQR